MTQLSFLRANLNGICFSCLLYSLLGLSTYHEMGEYVFYRLILLLICMDKETNPGPNENENNTVNTLEIFHLNARSMRNKLNHNHYIAELSVGLLTSGTEKLQYRTKQIY